MSSDPAEFPAICGAVLMVSDRDGRPVMSLQCTKDPGHLDAGDEDHAVTVVWQHAEGDEFDTTPRETPNGK